MIFSAKEITIPEGKVIKITDSNGVVLWKKPELLKNWVPYSINSDGTIYNNGLGYKEGYRVRSGGAETTQSTSTITGFIPLRGGDVVRISGADFMSQKYGAGNAINVSDESFTNIGQVVTNMAGSGYGIFASTYASYGFASVVQESEKVYKWVAPPSEDIKYMRITAETKNGDGLIVSVNQEIPV